MRLEVHGTLTPFMGNKATPEDVAIIAGANRFLIDLSGVTSITANASLMGLASRPADRRAMRIAVLAPADVTFGWTRQLLLTADEDPERVSVFRGEAEALAWLALSAPNEC